MLARKKVESTIGKTFADKLDEIVFHAEGWDYTRREMVELLGCANFIAAARLSKVLKRLGINSPAQLHKFDPFSLVRTKGIGEACIFVAMCILDHNNYDIMEWWKFKRDNVTKFSSFKHQAMRRAAKHKQVA